MHIGIIGTLFLVSVSLLSCQTMSSEQSTKPSIPKTQESPKKETYYHYECNENMRKAEVIKRIVNDDAELIIVYGPCYLTQQ